MATEIRVPTLGESIKEATIAKWFKKPGEAVKADEPLVELETEKVTVEVPAPAAGIMGNYEAAVGATVEVGSLLGLVVDGVGSVAVTPSALAPAVAPAAPMPPVAPVPPPAAMPVAAPATAGGLVMPPAPSARKLMTESGISLDPTNGSGRRGQILKEDVVSAVAAAAARPAPAPMPTMARAPAPAADSAREERVPMTRLRQTIARRLKDAQNAAAMLTTFNDVDMGAVMELRSQYKELFEKKHGIKLGFMGFFVKACVQALKEVPAVNAEIDGTDVVYKNYYHLGIAVGTEKGLVVPVLRNADQLSLAQVEGTISEYAKRARDGKLGIEDMQGGTFTITNGGVYGSLLSTPILNAPQSGILGMHRIEERPVVRAGAIVARPMMYLALSYDHRLVDGREAVTFLVRVKEGLEDPKRLILEL